MVGIVHEILQTEGDVVRVHVVAGVDVNARYVLFQ
jgi:hypothetical protein